MHEAFIERLREAIGDDRLEQALQGLQQPASVSVRLNPSKCNGVHLPILDGASGVEWSRWGYMLSERPVFTLHPLFHSGVYYVQDSSAMYVGEVFRSALRSLSLENGRTVRVLDLCAAPGGKTTDLAASLRECFGDRFLLVANEVMRNRATVLADNVARWGDPNVMVCSLDPKAFQKLSGFFDVIVADVPCSGEGMFRKDEEAVAQWSEDTVALCASRQRRIVADVWTALREGGIFIYSTCTFNREENDLNVRWMADELGAEILQVPAGMTGLIPTEYGCSLVPGFVPGEGQYCACVRKTSAESEVAFRSGRGAARPSALDKQISAYFTVPMQARQKGDMVIALPSVIAEDMEILASRLPVVSSGCAVGQFKGRDLVPDEDLSLCIALNREAFPSVPVDKPTALAFLHKDALVLSDSPRGLVLLTYKGVPLGFVKNLGNRTNNLHPLSRRIRMDID